VKKIDRFTRDKGTEWDRLAEKIAAEPGTVWQLVAGDDFPDGEQEVACRRLSTWARARGMKVRTSIPDRQTGATVEIQFRREGA
jgi:hypothetical protein